MQYQKIAGTKDILPDEVYLWQEFEAISRKIFSLHNFQEIRPPLVEEASLFNRSLGESAEIVQKQMFLINNKDETYALRPEGTASICRAYIENNIDKTQGFVKYYYTGPMFRLERPQKGRLRQFHHIGAEAIGASNPEIDIEIISLADKLLKTFSISGYKIKLNSLGCSNDKKELAVFLRENFQNKLNILCDDCKIRFEKNVLRILDCKNEACKEVVKGLNITNAHLCPDCTGHFSKVRAGLDILGINYELTPLLVRGLDYYTRTVFEISHSDLGSQDALGAGGRYDNLISQLGGPNIGAIGFAFGVERLLLVGSRKPGARSKISIYLITLGEEAKKEGMKLLSRLREAGISSDTDYENKSLKAAMRKANDMGAKFVLILGEDELKNGIITIKNMFSKEQIQLGVSECIEHILAAG